jgi:hypothetical protein
MRTGWGKGSEHLLQNGSGKIGFPHAKMGIEPLYEPHQKINP